MFVFKCPSCRKRVEAAEEQGGKWMECPICSASIRVPGEANAESSDSAITAVSPAQSSMAVTTPEQARTQDAPSSIEQNEKRDRSPHPPREYPLKSGSAWSLMRIGVLGACVFIGGSLFFALVVPAIQKVKEAAGRAQTMNHLKNIGLAAHSFHDASLFIPSPRSQPEKPPQGLKAAELAAPNLSWRVSLLPYLGQGLLWQQVDKGVDWNNANNLKFLPAMPSEYYCPAAGQIPPGTEQDTFLQALVGPHTLFPDSLTKIAMRDIPDGISNVFYVAQANRAVPWTKAEDIEVRKDVPLPLADRAFLVLMLDGTVHQVRRDQASEPILWLFIDPRDGQKVPDNPFD